MLACAIFAALDEILRGAGERVVRLAEWRHPAIAIVVEPDIEPYLRHPLGMAHGAGPRAAHFLGRAPPAVDDHQRVEQFLFPIGAAARLAPGERGERRDHGPHMVLLHIRIAEGQFDAPEPEHHRAVDPIVLLDAGKQRCILLGLFLARGDAPVGDAAVEILPDLFLELGLGAVELKDRGVGLDIAHDPRVGRVRDATRAGPGAERLDPLLEPRLAALRPGRCAVCGQGTRQQRQACSP